MSTSANPAAGLLPSPCIGVCRLDEATGWCVGCGRAGEELFGWGELPPARQRAVWAELPARMAQLRRPLRVAPWGVTALMPKLRALTAEPGTVWSMGGPGASAEFMASPQAAVTVADAGAGLLARHPDGALAFTPKAGVRGFVRDDEATGRELILARYRAGRRRPPASVVTELGADEATLDPAARWHVRFDLGLGQPAYRFAVRTGDDELLAVLRAAAGTALGACPDLARALVAASPTRVVATSAGRCEVSAAIPGAGAATPEGPHTHLLPDRLVPPGRFEEELGLPEGYLVEARIFARDDAWRAAGLELADPT
ncbi:MAG: DUF1289 domain-containing protein [Alphaproteobacteria bacterium]|jgi:predicted Fe-S protein YdhL (DUF1289 family)|nr:DUF1289 domain-containing protein [Alphaproteobacteria bacterium]